MVKSSVIESVLTNFELVPVRKYRKVSGMNRSIEQGFAAISRSSSFRVLSFRELVARIITVVISAASCSIALIICPILVSVIISRSLAFIAVIITSSRTSLIAVVVSSASNPSTNGCGKS